MLLKRLCCLRRWVNPAAADTSRFCLVRSPAAVGSATDSVRPDDWVRATTPVRGRLRRSMQLTDRVSAIERSMLERSLVLGGFVTDGVHRHD